jgi:enoyl-CoA hydratase/carnithine racemase
MIDLELADGIAVLSLNRPPVNGMSDAWVARFHEILGELEDNALCNVILVRSALKLFSGGADLKQIQERFAQPIERQLDSGRGYQALFARLESMPQVTIAEIAGAALGGGLELTLACDLRVASTRAKLGLPEVGLGLLPGAGGTQRLTRLCGRAVALRIILGAETISAVEAHRVGLVTWLVEDGEAEGFARARAQHYASMPRQAVAAAKAAIAQALDPRVDGYALETEGVRALLASPQTQQLVQAFLSNATAKK